MSKQQRFNLPMSHLLYCDYVFFSRDKVITALVLQNTLSRHGLVYSKLFCPC